MREEDQLKECLKIGIELINKYVEEFNAAGEWFQTLRKEEREEILSSGIDIQLAYRSRNSRGLMDLIK